MYHNRPKSQKLKSLVLIADAERSIRRNSGVSSGYTFLNADFEGVGFYIARQHVHLKNREQSKTSLSTRNRNNNTMWFSFLDNFCGRKKRLVVLNFHIYNVWLQVKIWTWLPMTRLISGSNEMLLMITMTLLPRSFQMGWHRRKVVTIVDQKELFIRGNQKITQNTTYADLKILL